MPDDSAVDIASQTPGSRGWPAVPMEAIAAGGVALLAIAGGCRLVSILAPRDLIGSARPAGPQMGGQVA